MQTGYTKPSCVRNLISIIINNKILLFKTLFLSFCPFLIFTLHRSCESIWGNFVLFPKQTLINFDIEYNIFDLFYFFGEAKNITTQYHIISYCVSCEQSISSSLVSTLCKLGIMCWFWWQNPFYSGSQCRQDSCGPLSFKKNLNLYPTDEKRLPTCRFWDVSP